MNLFEKYKELLTPSTERMSLGNIGPNIQRMVGNVKEAVQPVANNVKQNLIGYSQTFSPVNVQTMKNNVVNTFRPQTGSLATAVRNKVQPILNTPIPAPLQPAANSFINLSDRFLQSPVGQFGGGLVAGQNLGIGGSPAPKPQTPGQQIAFSAGSMIGALNPKSLTGKATRALVEVTNPILNKTVSPLAKNVIASRIGSGIANVAQGEVISKGLYGGNTNLGRALDFGTGVAFGPNQFRTTINTPDIDIKQLVKYSGKEGKQIIFKPNKILSREDITIVDQVLENVGKTKDLNYQDWNFLRNALKSVSKVTDEALDKLSPNQLINEVVRHTNLADNFYLKNKPQGILRPLEMGLSNQARGKIRGLIKDQISVSNSQDDAVKRINLIVDTALKAKKNKDYIQKLKTVRAELNRQMYDLTGADSGGNYKVNYAILQKAKQNPEIAEMIDTIETQILRIDDVIKGKNVKKVIKPVTPQDLTTSQLPKVQTTKPETSIQVRPVQPLTKQIQTSGELQAMKPSQLQNQKISGQPPAGIPPVQNKTQGVKGNQNQSKDLSYSVLDKLYTEFVDRFHPISKLAKTAGKDSQMRRTMAAYYGSGSTADYHLNQELSPILKEQNISDLTEAAIAMRDVELANRGIKGSPEQVKATQKLQELTTKLGQDKMQALGGTLRKLYAYQDAMVKRYLVDTGIMSKASYQEMRKNNQFYIPMKRVMDQVDEFLGIPVKRGAGSVGKQNVIYGIKGSDKDIVNPVESIVENTYKLVSLGKRQEFAKTIVGLKNELPDIITRAAKGDQQNTVGLFVNGKKVFYNVPEEVADAARGMSEEQLVTLSKILKVPTDLFRTMTTGVNPEFLIPNIARDTQSALFNAGVNPIKWVAGLAHYLKQDQVYKDFLQAGGKTSRVSINRPFLKQTAEELSGKEFTIKSPKDIVRGLEMLSQVSEQPTRIAVFNDAYKQSLKQGLSQEEALREAAYWAQEGTVNFARRGSKMTNINAIYAYLNARIQGIDRMVRTAKANPGKAAVRWGFGMMAPALALYAWNNRFESYNDERVISKRDKQDNFIFMLSDSPNGLGGAQYIKLPKSEIAKVVNPVEEFLDYARGRGGDVAQSVKALVTSFSPIDNVGGLIPTAINPVVENAMNKDFYTGYDLVPDYKKNLPAGYQDSNYTSPLFRMAGQKLNYSPAKLQNLAESYGGGMVRIAELASQPIIDDKYVTSKNEQGASINRTPVIRRFLGGEKKTVTEQQKADTSKQNYNEYAIRDIKSAMNRGDIPPEVGIEQINKLKGTTGSVQSNGNSITSENIVYYQNDKGKWSEIDLSFQPTPPELTGDMELDKISISKFNSQITQKKNDIYELYTQKLISKDEATKQLKELLALKNKYSSGKSKKSKLPKITPIVAKFPKSKSIKVAKGRVKQPKQYKLKKVSIKSNVTKVKKLTRA